MHDWRESSGAPATGVATLTRDGAISGMNPAYRELLGLGQQEFDALDVWSLTHQNCHDAIAATLRRLEDETVKHCRLRITHICRHGTLLEVEADISRQERIARESETTFVIPDTLRHDASEPAEASTNEQLRQALEDAESKNATRMLFLARLSHEVRTPLNGIIGFAELLESDPEETLTMRQREHVQQIREGGARLLRLVNDVLEFARSDNGQLALQDVPINLARLLQEAVTFLQPTAARSNVELTVQCDPAIGPVSGDPTRLLQVLNNLLSNAIKYTRPEGRVELSAVGCGQDRIEIRVSDTGIGIASGKQSEIFDMFVRADNGRASGQRGYGVGLAVTKGLVEQMGGAITVESAPGEGSIFTVLLPTAGSQEGRTIRPDPNGD